MPIRFTRTVPIFRIFSEEKAKEFYLGFLGFHRDWEHWFDPDAPVYMQVSRAGIPSIWASAMATVRRAPPSSSRPLGSTPCTPR
jgi:glyoxalase superfamily protein